ncbi:MAG: M15 family metallopeptidase [Arenimonas sp.]
MKQNDWRLINGEHFEALPCALVRGRGNDTKRLLSRTDWLVRRKSDGRFIAVGTDTWLQTFKRDQKLQRECEQFYFQKNTFSPEKSLRKLEHVLDALGIPSDYGLQHQLALMPEPSTLAFAGFDRYQRPLWMQDDAALAWNKMKSRAADEGIKLEAISGYRGHAYQYGIFKRKLARGQTVPEILKVNAAPGYSEHHTGRAIDIGTPNEAPAEETFESTAAFEWLMQNAGDFGFRLSYPRNNPHDINYEPWHWYFV